MMMKLVGMIVLSFLFPFPPGPDAVIDPAPKGAGDHGGSGVHRGPQLVCDEPVHDFGMLWVGPMLEHEFRLKNVGDESAWVRVTPTCSCTHNWRFPIDAGQTVGFTASVDSHKLRGKFDKWFRVRVLRTPDDQTCEVCRHKYESADHLERCGPVCMRKALPENVRVIPAEELRDVVRVSPAFRAKDGG